MASHHHHQFIAMSLLSTLSSLEDSFLQIDKLRKKCRDIENEKRELHTLYDDLSQKYNSLLEENEKLIKFNIQLIENEKIRVSSLLAQSDDSKRQTEPNELGNRIN